MMYNMMKYTRYKVEHFRHYFIEFAFKVYGEKLKATINSQQIKQVRISLD